MKLRIAVVALLALVGLPAVAHANGPSGSSETDNQVTCVHTVGPSGYDVGAGAAGNWLFVGTGGVEYCSDDDSGIDGRIVAGLTGGPYVAADGDATNPAQTTGCLRIPGDPGTTVPGPVSCGADNDGTQ